MRSGHAAEFSLPVLAAGVGVRRGNSWAIRSASFRLGPPGFSPAPLLDLSPPGPGSLSPGSLSPGSPGPGSPGPGQPGPSLVAPLLLGPSPLSPGSLGIAIRDRAAGDVGRILTGVLAGRIAPSYGSLLVLGEDMSLPAARAAVSREVGVARGRGLTLPAIRIRGLIELAARRTRRRSQDRYLLVAAILDRLALTQWAEVPLRSAPLLVERKARLAAALVHQPRLLLLDGLLDGLRQPEQAALSAVISDLRRDTPVIAVGRDAAPLLLACAQVLTLVNGIVVEPPPETEEAPYLPGSTRCDARIS